MLPSMIKKLLLICIIVFTSSACYSSEVTTYYFIRHAEKLRIDKTDQNPSLTEKGLERANAWQEIFSNVNLDAVYSTDYLRTKLTAKPTADSKNLPILIYDSKDIYSDSFQRETSGQTVLVVGHSNTTNVFANKALGEEKYGQIDDNNNSNLYIVTVIDEKPSSVLLKIN